MWTPPDRSAALAAALALPALLACGGELDCGDGTLLAEGESEFCVYAAAEPDHACPGGLPHQLYLQNGFPGWAEICTNAAPSADGTLELPAEVCDATGAWMSCLAVTAESDGLCCPYTEACSAGGHGGWAPRMESCPGTFAYDGAFSPQTDAFGCSFLAPRGLCAGGEMCCLE